MKFKYRTQAVNRPMVIKRGWEGEIEANVTCAYVGEWVVFRLPLGDSFAELRLPYDEAKDDGLVVAADSIVFAPEDFEEEYEDE